MYDYVASSDSKKQLTAGDERISVLKNVYGNLNISLPSITLSYGSSYIALFASHTAISLEEGLFGTLQRGSVRVTLRSGARSLLVIVIACTPCLLMDRRRAGTTVGFS